MNKFLKIGLILVVIVIFILGFSIYSSVAKETSTDIKDKTFSEIQYLEGKIMYMFNTLNNIEFENYKISNEEISEKSKKSSESSNSAGNGGDSSSGKESGEEESSSSSEEANDSKGGSSEANKTKKYSLNMQGVLTNEENINWDYIKKEAELLQNSMSTMMLDFYEIGLNNNDIINFSKEYDLLLVAIKNNDKEESLKELSSIYSYIPKFIKNCNNDEQYSTIISTKLDIFNAYTILDSENWNEINNYLQKANDTFSRLLTNGSINNKNQYTVNKCYVDLRNLQNCIETKDKEIFLIKYRNLLEDFNNL